MNRSSPEWLALRRWNLDQIERYREELEALNTTIDRTQQLRGMIAALREQIAMVEPTPKPEVKGTNYD